MNGDQNIRALTYHFSVLQSDQHPDDLGVSPWSSWQLCQHSCSLKVGLYFVILRKVWYENLKYGILGNL